MKINECVDFLKENDDFVLLTHVRPDGDTLGSAAALCSALRRAGKRAALYPNREITESFVPWTEAFISGEMPEKPCVVSIDTAAENMLPLGWEGDVRLCIDHHGSNTFYAGDTLVMPEKSACGQIILEVIEGLCGSVTPGEADLLYIAVSTDTGCFCYANTDAATFRAAARLLECGANSRRLNKEFFRSMSYSRLKLEGMIYAGLHSYRDNKINIASVSLKMMEEAGATEDDCDDLASLAGKVKGNVVAITIRELPNHGCKVSVRTNESVNASDVCAKFGGGGHPMASGCTLPNGIAETEKLLLDAVNEVWR